MDISTQATHIIDRLGIEPGLDLLRNSGFKYLDYSMFCLNRDSNFVNKSYLNIVRQTKNYADKIGIEFHQAHAPFPAYIDSDTKYNKVMFKNLIKSIESSSILGVKHIVIHPFQADTDQAQKNIEFYQKLAPYAKKYNVKIAIENLLAVCVNSIELKEYLNVLGNDQFTVCLDVGHCGLVGEDCLKIINDLGSDNLEVLHIQDNDGISDLHTLPFTNKIDFIKILKALKEIGYRGKLNLEADSFLIGFPDELLSDASKLTYKTVKYLADIYDEL